MATEASRHAFVSNLVKVYTLHSLDGIDIDWEYPGQQGDAGNIVSPSDSANFLSFLQLLRAKLPADAKITAATQTVPFAGADGKPLVNAAQFAAVLDWVLLMNYDTWGCESSSPPIVRSQTMHSSKHLLHPAQMPPSMMRVTTRPYRLRMPKLVSRLGKLPVFRHPR